MIIQQPRRPEKQIDSPQVVYQLLQGVLRAESDEDRHREHIWVLHLDARARLVTLELISLGMLNQTMVAPREVFVTAIARFSYSLVLAHNHPSGEPTPSENDIAITEQLVEAGQLLNIPIVDHVIVTLDGGYYSFRQEGLL